LPKNRRFVPSISSPQRPRHHVGDGLRRQLGRGGQVVLQVLVPLAQDLQVHRDDDGRTLRRARPVEQAAHEVVVLQRRPGTRTASWYAAATSSIEQIDMVDSVKGTPNFSPRGPP
jgi:hypothetical protein